MLKKIIWCLFIVWIGSADADDDNQSFELWQGINRNLEKQEQQILAEGELPQENTKQNSQGHGESIEVLLLTAINHYRWQELEKLIKHYQNTPNHDNSLLLFANASLAKGQGNYQKAEQLYKQLLAYYPNFVRAKLDLAKTQFENQENISARQSFTEINTGELPPMVDKNIKAYINAIDTRQSWHGSLSLGFIQTNNVNESSEHSDCLLALPSGFCVIERNAPEVVDAKGFNYEATLGKRFEIADHHSLIVRGLLYGRSYPHYRDYNESTLSISGGYSYQDVNDTLIFAPLAEYSRYGNKSLYHSIGIRGEWGKKITAKLNHNLQIEYKDRRYYDKRYRQNDGELTNLYSTLSYNLALGTIVFGGFDWERAKTDSPLNSSKQYGFRLGIYKQFDNGLGVSLSSTWRERQFDAYNPLLEKRRNDKKQIYSLTFKYNHHGFNGFTPALSIEHTLNNSNVEWLYSHKKTSVSLKIEKRF